MNLQLRETLQSLLHGTTKIIVVINDFTLISIFNLNLQLVRNSYPTQRTAEI